ncbi:hypothetical protein Tco_0464840 [Tanacetum coccineum]
MREFMVIQKSSNDFVKNQFFNLKAKVELGKKNHQAVIQDLETEVDRLYNQSSNRPPGTLPSNTRPNPKQPSRLNDKPYHPPPARNEHVNVVFTRSVKMYDPPPNPNDKTTIIHDDSNDKAEKETKEDNPIPSTHKQTEPTPMKEVRINVPLIDVLAGMPNYEKILKERVSNKNKLEEISAVYLNEQCSIIGKELNLRVGDKRITFLIDKAMQNSHSNDDTCFSIDINETDLDKEFVEFMEVKFEEFPKEGEDVDDSFEELTHEEQLRIKKSIQDPLIDLEMKPLPAHLEYAYQEKKYILRVIISSPLKDKEKERAENVAVDHVSHLENPELDELKEDEIDDNLPDETLMRIENDDEEIP